MLAPIFIALPGIILIFKRVKRPLGWKILIVGGIVFALALVKLVMTISTI